MRVNTHGKKSRKHGIRGNFIFIFCIFVSDKLDLARAVIVEFAGFEDEDFYNGILTDLRRAVGDMHAQLLDAGIMKPYDILLVNDEGETVANLYCVEEDTVVLDNEMIRKIDDDLDNFLKKLMEE